MQREILLTWQSQKMGHISVETSFKNYFAYISKHSHQEGTALCKNSIAMEAFLDNRQ
jgi:hypothetical protein